MGAAAAGHRAVNLVALVAPMDWVNHESDSAVLAGNVEGWPNPGAQPLQPRRFLAFRCAVRHADRLSAAIEWPVESLSADLARSALALEWNVRSPAALA